MSYLHKCHVQRHNSLGPRPLGPWGGVKRSDIIKSQSHSQFQTLLSQTLRVFSQMKIIKHIRWDFYLVAWVMHQGCFGGTVGCLWVIFFLKLNQIWCVSYLHEWYMQQHKYLGPRLLGLWGSKRSNIIKTQLQSQFQTFLNQTLCVFSQMKDIKHLR